MSRLSTQDSTFTYRAAKADGGVVSGSISAPSREAALQTLTHRGLWALDLRAHGAGSRLRWSKKRVPAGDLALGLSVLAELLDAALPLSRALATFEELAPAGWRNMLPAIRESVRQGKSLGSSLSDSPVMIPGEIVGIIQAGEAGSGLSSAVRRAAQLAEESESTRAALRAALAYPITLAAAGSASLALLVGVVLPRFASILTDIGQSLPASTQTLLSLANLARAHFVLMLVVPLVVLAVWQAWVSSDSGRFAWHAFLLELPLFGPIRRSAATGRACATLAALLESGVPLASSLPHVSRAIGDAALARRLMDARGRVIQGERLSRALADYAATTPTVIRLVRAGEESGRLARMLAHGARIEREQAVSRTKAAMRLLEPSLILLFGGIVAFVAAALLQALYSIRAGV